MARASAYFQGDRSFWDDGDFETLQEFATYAMLWQSHGIDIAGIRVRGDRIDALRVFDTLSGFRDTLSVLQNRGKILLVDNLIWIKSSIWHNLNKGECSDRQMQAVVNRLKSCSSQSLSATIVEFYKKRYQLTIPYAYPIDTLPIAYPSVSVSVSVSGTVSGTETGKNSGGEKSPPLVDDSRKKEEEELVGYLRKLPLFAEAKNNVVWSAAKKVTKAIFKDDPLIALECISANVNYLWTCDTIPKFIKGCYGTWRTPTISGPAESRAHKRRAPATLTLDTILKEVPR